MKHIAVFGGTFDPPTRAHEGIIKASLAQPGMDEVWLMPSGARADKPGMASEAARLAMLDLVRQEVFNGDERLRVTDFEQKLPQPTQTYQTVRALEAAYPEDDFWFVYGADAYHDMPKWHQGAELRERLGMLVVARSGFELPDESDRIRHLAITGATDGLSSTGFREAHQNGHDVEGFVCEAVEKYVRAEAMYTEDRFAAP